MTILFYAIPFFIVSMLCEWALTRGRPVLGYQVQDSAGSLAMGIGNLVVKSGMKFVTFAIFLAVYELRIFELDSGAWWVWVLLIVAEDFCYYWFHRASHEIRFFWAAHVNHHSSTHYNLSTALRQSWTSPVIGWIFWVPLLLVGFPPLMVVIAQSISLLYQYWIHTELIDKMGPFEWVLNTPSHHRVHHGSNPNYLDRNHGGIFIVWDRLFGTFVAEEERPTYGLTHNIDSHNPLTIAFHDWAAMARDVRDAKTWKGRLGYVFGPPGWREGNESQTSRALRAQGLRKDRISSV